MYQFPKDLYADVRIEEFQNLWLCMKNGEMDSDGAMQTVGALIRVFDGTMWYSCTTNKLDEIQAELDNLAALAIPNPEILEHPVVQNFQVHQDTVLRFEGDRDLRKVARKEWKQLLDHYVEACIDEEIPEINSWRVNVDYGYRKKSFFSSKGAAIVQDIQNCSLGIGFGITIDGITTGGGKGYSKFYFDELLGHEEEILQERDRTLEFAKKAVKLEPGEYTCVLAPVSTAMFVHESFGHKSEADFMLNDKTLQEEWIMGKQVGSEKVSICDRGDLLNHGYCPYDDEGTKAGEVWLMREGVLTGRLHDAKSAAALSEPITGNARAQGYHNFPIVRMTNTFMTAGQDDPQKMIEEVKDGVYIYSVDYGTGQATFTIKPAISYRIRDGKLAEPVRINVLTGSVFQALFDIDAVGTDYELFDTYTCGKGGQTVVVSAGGPSIRVKRLTVN
ncbi:MAG: TldD/PmbA family protein [Lachnospiraceae bacterium]|nr:TldD/PmbA family protein [Lachnospiraceae bacterium]